MSDLQGKGPDNPLLAVKARTACPRGLLYEFNFLFACFLFFVSFASFFFLKYQKPKFSVSKEMCFISISAQSDHYQVNVL